jgi:hypothetical protein
MNGPSIFRLACIAMVCVFVLYMSLKGTIV